MLHNGDLYSDYYFEQGSIVCYAGFAYECITNAEDCSAITPGTDEDIWETSNYEADLFIEDEYLPLSSSPFAPASICPMMRISHTCK